MNRCLSLFWALFSVLNLYGYMGHASGFCTNTDDGAFEVDSASKIASCEYSIEQIPRFELGGLSLVLGTINGKWDIYTHALPGLSGDNRKISIVFNGTVRGVQNYTYTEAFDITLEPALDGNFPCNYNITSMGFKINEYNTTRTLNPLEQEMRKWVSENAVGNIIVPSLMDALNNSRSLLQNKVCY